jgi:Xaa-Pro dipeptidase
LAGRLELSRAVKTADELEAIRSAARLCDVGQARVRELIAPGRSEIAIFAEARASMEQVAGQRIHVAGDLVTGERSGGYGGGLPRADLLEDGHLVISDIVPRLNGWWADSCATLAVGEPSAEHQKIHRIVADAFRLGVEAARPGIKASELDALVRGYVEGHGYQYGHHTGHGVGVAQSEAPWIVPYNDQVLEEGMVITIEPGIYPGGTGGVRIEDLFLVSSDGLEPLTHHDKRLEL